jgi:hypothetical protein
MSSEITTAFTKQFGATIQHLSQQKGSRLRSAVRSESQRGKVGFYDQLDATVAVKKTSRHSDTPQIDTPHARRRVSLVDYRVADLIDDEDKLRMLVDPTGDYATSFMWALGRAMDDEIIDNAFGTAYTGEEGNTSVSLTNSEKLAAHDGSTTTGVNLNVQTLRAAKKYFDANDVDPSLKRYMAIGSSQLQSLLGETEVQSSDYNTIKALVQGEVNTFLGFEFIRLERLPASATNITYDATDGTVGSGGGTITAANSRRCMAWAQDGLLLAVAQDMKIRVSERDDKDYSTQVFACMGIGSTRMEEKKFLEVDCSE